MHVSSGAPNDGAALHQTSSAAQLSLHRPHLCGHKSATAVPPICRVHVHSGAVSHVEKVSPMLDVNALNAASWSSDVQASVATGAPVVASSVVVGGGLVVVVFGSVTAFVVASIVVFGASVVVVVVVVSSATLTHTST